MRASPTVLHPYIDMEGSHPVTPRHLSLWASHIQLQDIHDYQLHQLQQSYTRGVRVIHLVIVFASAVSTFNKQIKLAPATDALKAKHLTTWQRRHDDEQCKLNQKPCTKSVAITAQRWRHKIRKNECDIHLNRALYTHCTTLCVVA